MLTQSHIDGLFDGIYTAMQAQWVCGPTKPIAKDSTSLFVVVPNKLCGKQIHLILANMMATGRNRDFCDLINSNSSTSTCS
jgi:hypothetical protein